MVSVRSWTHIDTKLRLYKPALFFVYKMGNLLKMLSYMVTLQLQKWQTSASRKSIVFFSLSSFLLPAYLCDTLSYSNAKCQHFFGVLHSPFNCYKYFCRYSQATDQCCLFYGCHLQFPNCIATPFVCKRHARHCYNVCTRHTVSIAERMHFKLQPTFITDITWLQTAAWNKVLRTKF